jgi:hypothetical protein
VQLAKTTAVLLRRAPRRFFASEAVAFVALVWLPTATQTNVLGVCTTLQCLMLALDAPLVPNIPAASKLLGKMGAAGSAGRHLLQRHRCMFEYFNSMHLLQLLYSCACAVAMQRQCHQCGRAVQSGTLVQCIAASLFHVTSS